MNSKKFLVAAAAFQFAVASAQNFSVDWFTIAAGGGSMGASGPYSADITIGQAVAAAGPDTGDYAFTGGFWTLLGFPTSSGVQTNTDYGVSVCTNRITGTVRFNNSNPAILDLLNAPGNEGMQDVFIYANSLPRGYSSTSGWQPSSSKTSSDYSVVVDTDCTNSTGVTYEITPGIALGAGEAQYYTFNSKTAAPVVAGLAGPVVDFVECLGVVQFNFVDEFGSPVSVTGGNIIGDYYNAYLSAIPNGATQQRFYARGGETHVFRLTLYRGSDVYSDRQVHSVSTNLMVGCDTILNVNIVIPSLSTLGQITGTVHMLREFEWNIHSFNNVPDWTTVLANNGPFSNQRWARLGGDDTNTPSSGAFSLVNVEPSTADPNSAGYSLQAYMMFRANRRVEAFYSPTLGFGSNPAVAVTPGATVNLSNIFQIDPGYVRGAIRLQGPAETPGHPSMLRGVFHCGDDDLNHDGIPDVASYYGVYESLVGYDGVDRAGADAHYTAANGFGYADFDGDFDAITSSYLGNYELALGGLQGERSLWRHSYFSVSVGSPTWTDSPDDYSNFYAITDRRTNSVEVIPNQPVTNDLAYGFGEVIVHIFSTSASFSRPQIQFFGGLTGNNFLGQPADYHTDWGTAAGTPFYYPTNHALIRLLLPEGTYNLYPIILPQGYGNGTVSLTPIDVTVGAGQRLDLGTCLTLDLAIPGHSLTNLLTLSGSVLTQCSNIVGAIFYQLNGGPPVNLCSTCGINPNFTFTVPLVPGTNSLTVTAQDDQGAVSSISGVIQYDAPAPLLSILLTDTNTVLVSWPSPSTGFRLVQSTILSPGSWADVTDTINDDGTTKSVLVSPAGGKRFFRLSNP
ncbi:MAG: hypothetical protein C5B50_01840 [Verrucomicrobia bacterium]|nr:MAG: hypothetical protein C5B50_01840 [Verrucomicrobiota bacterium]